MSKNTNNYISKDNTNIKKFETIIIINVTKEQYLKQLNYYVCFTEIEV